VPVTVGEPELAVACAANLCLLERAAWYPEGMRGMDTKNAFHPQVNKSEKSCVYMYCRYTFKSTLINRDVNEVKTDGRQCC